MEIVVANFELRHLTQADLNLHVWRYLTFPKYVSMMIYSALWFPKLKTLLSMDADEGAMPIIAASFTTNTLVFMYTVANSCWPIPGFRWVPSSRPSGWNSCGR